MTIKIELEDVSTENIKKMTELLKTDLEKLNKEVDEAEKTKEAMKKVLFSIENIGAYEYTCAYIDYSDACDALWTIEGKRRDLMSALNLMSLEVADREGELER
jgi:hypothetical protein